MLRRGLAELDQEAPPLHALYALYALRALADAALAQLRSTSPGAVLVTPSVATAAELLAELATDRADR